jgi:hypothetical protein
MRPAHPRCYEIVGDIGPVSTLDDLDRRTTA